MEAAFSPDRFLAADPLDRVRQIERRFPASALSAVADGDTVTLSDLSRVVASRRTLGRRVSSDGNLSVPQSDRLARFIGTHRLATEVFGDRVRGMRWLRSPERRLQDRRPIDLMRTYIGDRAVADLLGSISHHGPDHSPCPTSSSS